MDDEINYKCLLELNLTKLAKKEFDHPPYLLIEPVSACNQNVQCVFKLIKLY